MGGGEGMTERNGGGTKSVTERGREEGETGRERQERERCLRERGRGGGGGSEKKNERERGGGMEGIERKRERKGELLREKGSEN